MWQREKTLPDFVGVRVKPHQRKTLLAISQRTAKPGSLSAGLRWLVDHAEEIAAASNNSEPKKGMTA